MFDMAEAIHGLREGEPGIGVLALIIATMHGAAAVVAYLRRGTGTEWSR